MFTVTCHPEPTSPEAKQMKFSRWLNAIDLLRKLPKTSGYRVILSEGHSPQSKFCEVQQSKRAKPKEQRSVRLKGSTKENQ